jgi:MFS family permease
MLWAGISEIYGRKIVYMVSFAMFALTQLGCALSNSPGLFLAMRVLSACGGSAVLTIGGGTLVGLTFLSSLVRSSGRSLTNLALAYRPTSTILTNEVPWSESIISFLFSDRV